MGSEPVDSQVVEQVLDIAIQNIDNAGGPFGAAVVYRGDCVSTGANRVTDSYDPSAHAEVMALRSALELQPSMDWSQATLYTSCEPCPMCLSACMELGVNTIQYVADRHAAAKAGFDDAFLYDELSKPWTDRQFVIREAPFSDETSQDQSCLTLNETTLYGPSPKPSLGSLNGVYVQLIQHWCGELGQFSLEGAFLTAPQLPTLFELALLYWARVKGLYCHQAGWESLLGDLFLKPDFNAIRLIPAPSERALYPFDKWRQSTTKTRY